MKKPLFVAAASLILLAQSALAEESSGFYIAGGPSVTDIPASSCSTSGGGCNTPNSTPSGGATYRVLAGFDIIPQLGVEAGYTNFGTYSYSPTTSGTVGISAATLGLRAGASRARRVAAFGEFGVASVRTQYNSPTILMQGAQSQRNNGFYGGVGVELNFHRAIGARVSLNYINFSDSQFSGLLRSVSAMLVLKL